MAFDHQAQLTIVNFVGAGRCDHSVCMQCRGMFCPYTGKRASFVGNVVVNISHHRWAVNVSMRYSLSALNTDGQYNFAYGNWN